MKRNVPSSSISQHCQRAQGEHIGQDKPKKETRPLPAAPSKGQAKKTVVWVSCSRQPISGGSNLLEMLEKCLNCQGGSLIPCLKAINSCLIAFITLHNHISCLASSPALTVRPSCSPRYPIPSPPSSSPLHLYLPLRRRQTKSPHQHCPLFPHPHGCPNVPTPRHQQLQPLL